MGRGVRWEGQATRRPNPNDICMKYANYFIFHVGQKQTNEITAARQQVNELIWQFLGLREAIFCVIGPKRYSSQGSLSFQNAWDLQ